MPVQQKFLDMMNGRDEQLLKEYPRIDGPHGFSVDVPSKKKKRVAFKVLNTWREDQTVSIGGYAQYCGEQKEFTFYISVLIFDVWIDINFK